MPKPNDIFDKDLVLKGSNNLKQYTITLKEKNKKEPVYKETVMAESKIDAWSQIRVGVTSAMWKVDFNGEIEIKEG